MTELTSYCDIILGNEEDAEKHFGIHPEGLDIHKHQITDIVDRIGEEILLWMDLWLINLS